MVVVGVGGGGDGGGGKKNQTALAVDGRTVSSAHTHAHREYEAGCSKTLVTKASVQISCLGSMN